MSKTEQKMCAHSFRDCFYMDKSELNPIPKGITGKLAALFLNPCYSMSAFMRLSQYYHLKSINVNNRLRKKAYTIIASFFRRANQVSNHFEHGVNPHVAAGVVFHHCGVCITSGAVIESGVHIFRDVTFGTKNNFAPHVKKEALIGGHSVLLGKVVIGERAIVAPGAVVVKDVPPHKIAAGVPAKIIGEATDDKRKF